MREKELWKHFWNNQISHSRPLGRYVVMVAKKDFEPIEKYFTKEFNVFHRGKSLRSRGLISHIHAIDQGEHIFAHRDTGNLARFRPLAPIHFVCDLVPYLIFAKIKKVPMTAFFTGSE